MLHAAALAAALAFCAPAAGQVPMLLHRQAPARTFGYTSDTAARDQFGQITGQLVADRFELAGGGEVCRVVAWAFFGGMSEPFDPPPPATETLRVRFYDEAAGLPGSELLSQTFVDPPRVWTGSFVALGPLRREYRYEFHLNPCFAAAPGTAYWVELSQIGIPESHYRWENSAGFTSAVQFPLGTPWRTLPAELAYELWTPEPPGILLIGAGMMGAAMRRRKRQR